jgi:DNA-binding transcriptional MerR regulator
VKYEGTRLLSIGEFAALTRLAPSALRYYDDAGLLRPVHVDADSGYRRYAPAQVPEAVLIRELRALAMPIADVRALLTAGPAGAHRRLDEHWRAVEARVVEARSRVGLAHQLIDRKEGQVGTMVTIDAGLPAGSRTRSRTRSPRLSRPGASSRWRTRSHNRSRSWRQGRAPEPG